MVVVLRGRLTRIAQSFWTQTEDRSEEHRALRALVLHMLEHHAPQVFAELGLDLRLAEAIADLADLPAALDPDLPLPTAMARIDACFVRFERSAGGPTLDAAELGVLLWQLESYGDDIHVFILGEMAALIGIETCSPLGDLPYRDADRTEVESVKPEAVTDPTGCGDAYRSGLLYGLARGWSVEAGAKLGSLMGSLKVAHSGPQSIEADRDDISKRFDQAFGADRLAGFILRRSGSPQRPLRIPHA